MPMASCHGYTLYKHDPRAGFGDLTHLQTLQLPPLQVETPHRTRHSRYHGPTLSLPQDPVDIKTKWYEQFVEP